MIVNFHEMLPLSFRENLVSFKLSNSALLTCLMASSSPSGSSTTLLNWLNKASLQPLTVPQGMVRLVFDNEQVVGKRYRVKAGQSTVPMSAITSHLYMLMDENCNIQYEDKYKPSNWMFNDINEEIEQIVLNSFDKYNDTFRSTRNNFIKKRLSVILDSSSDEETSIDPYSHFEIQPTPNEGIQLHPGDPDMRNPNSREHVLQRCHRREFEVAQLPVVLTARRARRINQNRMDGHVCAQSAA